MAPKNNPPQQPGVLSLSPELEAELAGLQGSMATSAQPQTIGAPRYKLEEQTGAGLLPKFRFWQEGDQWDPQTWSPADQARLKAKLAGAGLYGDEGYRPGGWTETDARALTDVLAFANGQGIEDINTAAGMYGQMARTEGVLARAPRQPLVTRWSNPESVRQVIRAASLQMMGQRLSDAEEQKLVAGFQAQAAAAARGQAAAQNATTGDVAGYTEALDPEEYAYQQLQSRPETGAQRYLEAFDKIHRSLTTTKTQGPNISQGGGVEF